MRTPTQLPIQLAAIIAAGSFAAGPAAAAPHGSAPRSGPGLPAPGVRGQFPHRGNGTFHGYPHHHHGGFPSYGYRFYPTTVAYPFYWPYGGYGYGYGYGYTGFGYPTLNSYYGAYSAPVPVTQQVVVVRPPVPAPAAEVLEAPRERRWSDGEDSRFYLEPRSETQKPKSAVEAVTSQLRVEQAEPGTYLVRWTGDPSEITWLDLQAVDEARQVLGTRSLQEAPFKGLLSVPAGTKAVVLSVEYRSGKSISVKLPLADFRALATP